jgi:hypothetical protein
LLKLTPQPVPAASLAITSASSGAYFPEHDMKDGIPAGGTAAASATRRGRTLTTTSRSRGDSIRIVRIEREAL